jgi:hypothetical protein
MALFWTDSIVLCYSDVSAAKEWWVRVFDCKAVKVPPDWDNPLPSDCAMRLPGDEGPRILLSSRSEVQEAGLSLPEHPIIFTGKLEKAYRYLSDRGVPPGNIRDGGGTALFEIADPEGNVIEICKEL